MAEEEEVVVVAAATMMLTESQENLKQPDDLEGSVAKPRTEKEVEGERRNNINTTQVEKIEEGRQDEIQSEKPSIEEELEKQSHSAVQAEAVPEVEAPAPPMDPVPTTTSATYKSEPLQKEEKCCGLSRSCLLILICLALTIPFVTILVVLYMKFVTYTPTSAGDTGSSIGSPIDTPIRVDGNGDGTPTVPTNGDMVSPTRAPSTATPTQEPTLSRTNSPTTTRFQTLFNMFSSAGLLEISPELVVNEDFASGGQIFLPPGEPTSTTSTDFLSDPTSPSYRAMNWLANDDPLQLPLIMAGDFFGNFGNSSDIPYRLLQRYSLVTFYFATGGNANEWWKNTDWLSDKSECQWFGLSCGGNNGNDQDPLITSMTLGKSCYDVHVVRSMTSDYV